VNPASAEWSESDGDVLLEYLNEDLGYHVLVELRDDFHWYVLWDDLGPNGWGERYERLDQALARVATIVRAAAVPLFLKNKPYLFAFDWNEFVQRQLH
jgi:hypothetical protein